MSTLETIGHTLSSPHLSTEKPIIKNNYGVHTMITSEGSSSHSVEMKTKRTFGNTSNPLRKKDEDNDGNRLNVEKLIDFKLVSPRAPKDKTVAAIHNTTLLKTRDNYEDNIYHKTTTSSLLEVDKLLIQQKIL